MAERNTYSAEKAAAGVKDAEALLLVSAMAIFAFIGLVLMAPLRRR